MKRILAVFIAFVQLTSVGAGEVTIWADRRAPVVAAITPPLLPALLSPSKTHAEVSLKNGVVHETHKGTTPEKIYLIQDIHLNSEAQANIAAILQNLINRQSVDLVAVEGAFEPYDFRPFRSFPKKGITKALANSFLEDNRIDAPSYVGVTSAVEPPLFIGVDDEQHYDANVQAYLDALEIKSATAKKLAQVEAALFQARPQILSRLHLVFDQTIDDYENGRLDAAGFILQGRKFGWRSEQIDHFLRACQFEKTLNMKQVEYERSLVLNRLAEKLSKKDQDVLTEQTRRYEEGSLRYAQLYSSLVGLFARYDISLAKTPAFRDYLRYLAESDAVDGEKLVADMERWRNATVEKLAVTNAQKQLAQSLEWMRLAKKLTEFSLTPAEWESYKRLREPSWEAALDPFEQFYLHADLRSQLMVENLLAHQARGAALVTGGFHAPRVRQLLKERGLSYAVITPKVTTLQKEDGTFYLSAFTQEKAPIDMVFSGKKLFTSPGHLKMGNPRGPNDAFRAGWEAIDGAFASGVETTVERGDKRMKAVPTKEGGVRLSESPSLPNRISQWIRWVRGTAKPKQRGRGNRLHIQSLEQRLAFTVASPVVIDEVIVVSQEAAPVMDGYIPTDIVLSNSKLDEEEKLLLLQSNAQLSDLEETLAWYAAEIERQKKANEQFAVDPGLQPAPVTALPLTEAVPDYTKAVGLLDPEAFRPRVGEDGEILPVRAETSLVSLGFFGELPDELIPENNPFEIIQANGSTYLAPALGSILEVELWQIDAQPPDTTGEQYDPRLINLKPGEQPRPGHLPAELRYKVSRVISASDRDETGSVSINSASPFSDQELDQLIADGKQVLVVVRLRQPNGAYLNLPDTIGATDFNPRPGGFVIQDLPAGPNSPVFEKPVTPPSTDGPGVPLQDTRPPAPKPNTPTHGGGGNLNWARAGSVMDPTFYKQFHVAGMGSGNIAAGGGTAGVHRDEATEISLVPEEFAADLDALFEEEGDKDELDEEEDFARVPIQAIANDGSFITIEIPDVKKGKVTYQVVFVKGDQVIRLDPREYKAGDKKPVVEIPEGFEAGDIVVKTEGENQRAEKIILDRFEPEKPKTATKPKEAPPAIQKQARASTPFIVAVGVAVSQILSGQKKPDGPTRVLLPTGPAKKSASFADKYPYQGMGRPTSFGRVMAPRETENPRDPRYVVLHAASNDERSLRAEVQAFMAEASKAHQATNIVVLLNEKNQGLFGKLQGKFGPYVSFATEDQYSDSEKLAQLLAGSKGRVSFFIRNNPAVSDDFYATLVQSVRGLSDQEGFVGRIIDLIILATYGEDGAFQVQTMDEKFDKRLIEMIRQNA